MQIEFKNRTFEKECTVARETEKKHGKNMAALIHQRIDEIEASDSIETLLKFRIGGCHRLKGQRKEQYAMNLIQPFRLVFEMKGREIQVVRIIEITNYH